MKLNIGQKVYTFSINTRVYSEENGSGPIYRNHFIEHAITGENDKEYLVDGGYRKINKRSNLMDRERYFNKQEMEDNIYIHDNAYKISRKIEVIRDANKLKAINKLLEDE